MANAPERFGSYLVYERLGQGGMAQVHRAELPQRNGTVKQVALKRLLPTLQKELVALFLDEARLLRYLDHPNIAATFDSGRVFGTYFIAMEYVRGPTLKQVISHTAVTVGGVPEPVAINIAAQLCDALDHAHNRKDENGSPLGIVHRDVSPANIILSDTGMVKLIDFGLAKAKVSTEETAQGMIKGKYAYVAPEYLGGNIDHRSDLWAVGIIMYELLTGRRLFDGPDAFETMMRVRSLPIPRPSLANPRVTPELDEVVMKALDRAPSRRWQSAAQMGAGLREVIAKDPHSVDNKHVIDWVNWAFTQRPGTDVSGVSHLLALVKPAATIVLPAPGGNKPEASAAPDDGATIVSPPPIDMVESRMPAFLANLGLSRAGWLWFAGALVVTILVIASLVSAI